MATTTTLYPTAWAKYLLIDEGYDWQTDSLQADRTLDRDDSFIAYRFELPSEKYIKAATAYLQYVIPSSNFNSGTLYTSFGDDDSGDKASMEKAISAGSSGSMSFAFSSSSYYASDPEGVLYESGTGYFSAFKGRYLYIGFMLREQIPTISSVTIQGPRLTVTYENIPTISLNTPANNDEYNKGESIPFSWSVSNGTQASAVIQYSTYSTFPSGGTYTLANISGSTTSYTSDGSAFSTGRYYWRVVVTTTGNVTVYSDYRALTVNNYTRITSPANGASFTEGDSITLQWETSFTQRYCKVERSANSGSSWITLVNSGSSVKTITDYAGSPGTYTYRVSAGESQYDLIVSKTITVTVNALPTPSITPVQPWGDVIYADQAILFSWNVSNATQASAYLYYSTNGGSTWTQLASRGSSTQYTASANTFSAGQIYWKVSVTATNGKSAESSPVSFTVMEPYVPPAPDDPPTVGSVSVSPINSGLHADFSNTAIAGISRCRVQASVSKGTNNISRVYLTYPEQSGSIAMTLTGGVYVGETTLALSQSTTFTVTAVDTEGYYDSDTVSISVEPYAAPTIRVNTLIRCDASGAEDGSGTYFLINAAASCSSVDGKNYIVSNSFTARVKNSSNYVLVTNNVNTRSNVGELVNEDAVYVIVVSVTDHVGSTSSVEISLAGRLRDVVFKRDTTHNTVHVGIGMSPAGGDETSIQLPPGGKIIIGGQDITAWLRNQIGGNW